MTGRHTGYHSNRRLPRPHAVRAVQPLYRAMRVEERRHSRAVEAAAAGEAVLQEFLHDKGVTYDELVWTITEGVDA